MTGADPIVVLVLAVAVAALFGSRTRRGRPLGAFFGAAAAGILTGLVLGRGMWLGLAVCLGAAVGWLAPAQGRSTEPAWDGETGGGASGRW